VEVPALAILGSTSAAPPSKPKKAKVANVVPEIVAVVAPVEVKVKKVKTLKVPNDNPIVRRKKLAKVVEGVKIQPVPTTVSFE